MGEQEPLKAQVVLSLYHCRYHLVQQQLIQFGTGGSDLVEAIQKDLGLKVDRNMGPSTIGSMQAKAGTAVDRKITRPSALAKQMKHNLKSKGKPW